MNDLFTRAARRTAHLAGSARTFLLALALVLTWAITGPVFHFSETWQLVINTGTTIVTFLMVFLIQSSQNHDSAAMQLKLDELIRAVSGAQNSLISLETGTEDEMQRQAEALHELAGMHDEDGEHTAPGDTPTPSIGASSSGAPSSGASS